MKLIRLLPALVLVAASPSETEVRLARVEGAAASLRQSASAMTTTAHAIVASGRFQGMEQLHGDAVEVNRNVISARLAVDFMAESLED